MLLDGGRSEKKMATKKIWMKGARARLGKEIIDAMNYREGSYYVGGMAAARVIRIINGVYGTDSVEKLIKVADLNDLKKAHEYLDSQGFIERGRDRVADLAAGVKFCPHCGMRI